MTQVFSSMYLSLSKRETLLQLVSVINTVVLQSSKLDSERFWDRGTVFEGWFELETMLGLLLRWEVLPTGGVDTILSVIGSNKE